jgi:hypothetical protein
MENNNDLLKKEIKFRMESDVWNLSMARRVIDLKNSRNKKFMNAWSMASLATAAMAFIIFMTNIYSVMQKNNTYSGEGSIYSYAYIKNDYNLDNDTIAARVELLINETYPMR